MLVLYNIVTICHSGKMNIRKRLSKNDFCSVEELEEITYMKVVDIESTVGQGVVFEKTFQIGK